ncbi:hypothetical protein [Noviherbaspirillum sp.]|uniref:hypothetical protein n=1 Tax=Noviherbaspirillum sp. TaxID=1926288 RepID=UPI002FE4149A
MTFSIGSIIWPADGAAAIRLYLGFLVQVLTVLKINFHGRINDPLKLTKDYLERRLSDEERNAASAAWWSYLDSQGAIRDLQNQDALMARLAICLLSVREKDVPELGENLSWFFEVLGFLGMDLDKPIDMMCAYFKSSAR